MAASETKAREAPQIECWEVLESREVFAAAPWIHVYREKIRLPEGRMIDDYHSVALADCVIVYAETGDCRVVVERRYHHGAGSVGLSLPAGAIGEGEDPLLAAQRELLEETGYAAPVWRALGCYTVNGNYGCGTARIYLATGASRVAEPDSGDLEAMEVLLLDRDELRRCLREGDIHLLGAAAAALLGLGEAGAP